MKVKGSEANLWCSVALVTISCGVLNQPCELWLSEVLNCFDIVIGSERAIGVVLGVVIFRGGNWSVKPVQNTR